MKKALLLKLKPSTISSEVGIFKQLEPISNYWEVENNFESMAFRQFSEHLNLNTFKLKKSAKLTDVLSAEMLDTSKGIFVSNRFRELLEGSNLCNGKYYDLLIYDSKGKLFISEKYFFLQIVASNELINFNKSRFSDVSKGGEIVQLEDSSKLNPKIFPKLIILKEIPDFFRLPFSESILASENFAEILTRNNITGITFEEFDYVEIYTE